MKNIITKVAEMRGARQAVKNYDNATRMTPEKKEAIEKIRASYAIPR